MKHHFYFSQVLLFLSPLVLIFSVFSMESSKSSKIREEKLKTSFSQANQQAINIFDHDPAIRIHNFPDNPKKSAVVFLHGFGCDGNAIEYFSPTIRKSKKLKLPDDETEDEMDNPWSKTPLRDVLITFDFKDKKGEISDIRKTSLGQLPEVLLAAYVVGQTYKAGFKKISLASVSRGSNVALNLLRFLADEKYLAAAKKIGIKNKRRKSLLTCLKKGIVILEVPLTYAPRTIKKTLKKTFKAPLPLPLIRCLFSIFTHYSSNGMEGIDSVKWLCDNNHIFTSAWFLQKNDTVIYNNDSKECIKMLKKINPDGTYYFKGQGDHMDPISIEFIQLYLDLLNESNKKTSST